jgi:YHS domain-containing protein
MLSRRSLLLSIPLLSLLACTPKKEERASAGLDPSDTVDPAFSGCQKSCGLHGAKDRREAKRQPGVAPGDATFCPVSGAVFRIAAETPKRTVHGGMTLYFCCEACAAWFTQHEAEVLAKRGLA